MAASRSWQVFMGTALSIDFSPSSPGPPFSSAKDESPSKTNSKDCETPRAIARRQRNSWTRSRASKHLFVSTPSLAPVGRGEFARPAADFCGTSRQIRKSATKGEKSHPRLQNSGRGRVCERPSQRRPARIARLPKFCTHIEKVDHYDVAFSMITEIIGTKVQGRYTTNSWSDAASRTYTAIHTFRTSRGTT